MMNLGVAHGVSHVTNGHRVRLEAGLAWGWSWSLSWARPWGHSTSVITVIKCLEDPRFVSTIGLNEMF